MKKGFTLLETLFAILILTTGFFSTFSLLRKSISTTTTSINQLIATNLTQEGIEIVRNIRDSQYVSGNSWAEVLSNLNNGSCSGCEADINSITLSSSDQYLKIDPITNRYQYASGEGTLFKRKININQGQGLCLRDGTSNPNDCIKIDVEVSWQERGQEFNFGAEDYIYNLY
jgi:Tfp pilus assembly protein PilV